MKCPACSKEMAQENFGVLVDVCEGGCQGIWFDHGELQMLDEKNEGLGAALDKALQSPRRNDGQRGRIACPKCGIPMQTHRYARAENVSVDECYGCGGFFLDSGELEAVRDHYMSDADVAAYTDQIVQTVPEYAQEVTQVERQQQRLKAIQNYTKCMTLHYWREKL